MDDKRLYIRVTGLLIEADRVLAVEEVHETYTQWCLPGGKLEYGETVVQGLAREIREETGLEVAVGELLYVTDRFRSRGNHDVDLCFAVHLVGGNVEERQASDGGGEIIGDVRLIPIDDLPKYGFGEKFVTLIREGFPNKGSYYGMFHELYG